MLCMPMVQVNQLDGLQHMHIPSGQQYKSPGEAYVEGDASSASYFLAGKDLTLSLACTLTVAFRGSFLIMSWCRLLTAAGAYFE